MGHAYAGKPDCGILIELHAAPGACRSGALSDAALSVWPEASPPASRFEPVTPLSLGLSLGAPGAWVETELLLNSQYTDVIPVLPAAAADLPPFPLREAPQTLCKGIMATHAQEYPWGLV